MSITLPRENLFRALPEIEVRDDAAGGMPTLRGVIVPFNEWTEINSVFEGRFIERFAPGSIRKTMKEGRSRIRCLFQHGYDPQIGDKPLGPIERMYEDGEAGARYEVPMLDTQYNRDLVPGLKAGLYGSSNRFSIVREELVDEPELSEHNPHGLPERTVLEARLLEFGPVTFPAYAGATATARSVTDEFRAARLAAAGPDQLRSLLDFVAEMNSRAEQAEPEAAAGPEAPEGGELLEGGEEPQDQPTQDALSDAALAGTSERRVPSTKDFGLRVDGPDTRPSWSLD